MRLELDGRFGHEWSLDRWDDLDRDVDSAVEGHLTVRIGWRQVLEPCRLAERMARILVARGLVPGTDRVGHRCSRLTWRIPTPSWDPFDYEVLVNRVTRGPGRA